LWRKGVEATRGVGDLMVVMHTTQGATQEVVAYLGQSFGEGGEGDGSGVLGQDTVDVLAGGCEGRCLQGSEFGARDVTEAIPNDGRDRGIGWVRGEMETENGGGLGIGRFGLYEQGMVGVEGIGCEDEGGGGFEQGLDAALQAGALTGAGGGACEDAGKLKGSGEMVEASEQGGKFSFGEGRIGIEGGSEGIDDNEFGTGGDEFACEDVEIGGGELEGAGDAVAGVDM
jgi:hypothetical protein